MTLPPNNADWITDWVHGEVGYTSTTYTTNTSPHEFESDTRRVLVGWWLIFPKFKAVPTGLCRWCGYGKRQLEHRRY